MSYTRMVYYRDIKKAYSLAIKRTFISHIDVYIEQQKQILNYFTNSFWIFQTKTEFGLTAFRKLLIYPKKYRFTRIQQYQKIDESDE